RDFHVTGVQTCALPIYIIVYDGNCPALQRTFASPFRASEQPLLPVCGRVRPRAAIAGDSMLFDDRLATVLRLGARSEAAARTQYRQLLDLLGPLPPGTANALADAPYE